jgi:hypothetical protein
MYQVIQLYSDDDIPAIRSQIENAELSHVILNVPRDCKSLQTEHGMRLLRRAADDAGSQIALVAHDNAVRENANRFGIPVFNSLANSQRTRWRMDPLETDGARSIINPPPPEHISPTGLARFKPWRGTILVVVLVTLAFCIASFLFVPAANVRIMPASVALSMTTDAAVDTTAAQPIPDLRAVPARRLIREVSGNAQMKTTTTKNVPDARSTGTVTFTNLRSDQIDVPSGTVVKTSAGVAIRFTTVTTATVPAGVNGRVEAQVVAVDPGPSGNVKELAINTVDGPFSLNVRVINLKPMASGNVRAVRVVTDDDKKKIQVQLLAQMKQQGVQVLQKELKETEFLVPDSVIIDTNDQTYDRAVDEPADVLNLRINASAIGLAVDRDDLTNLASALVKKQVQAGYQLLANGVQSEPLAGGKYDGALFRMPFRVVAYTVPQIDSNAVARVLQGRTVDDAKQYLSTKLSLAKPPEINTIPPMYPLMPFFNFRIVVFVDQPTVSKK